MISRRSLRVLEKDLALAERNSRDRWPDLDKVAPPSVQERLRRHFRSRAAALREALAVLRPLAKPPRRR